MSEFRVAGVSFANPDGQPRKEVLAALFDRYFPDRLAEVRLELVPEDSNEHDPNAVAVLVLEPEDFRGKQLGYVPSDLAPLYRRALSRDRVGRAELLDMNAGSRGGISAKVKVYARREDT